MSVFLFCFIYYFANVRLLTKGVADIEKLSIVEVIKCMMSLPNDQSLQYLLPDQNWSLVVSFIQLYALNRQFTKI